MQSQFDLLGAFVPTIAAWFVLLLAVFVAVDALLTWRGFYRLFWRAPLARFALFGCLFCGSALVLTSHCRRDQCRPSYVCCLLSSCSLRQVFYSTSLRGLYLLRHG